MAIDFDKVNQAYNTIKALRQSFVEGVITKEELEAQLAKIRAEIKLLLGFPPPPV